LRRLRSPILRLLRSPIVPCLSRRTIAARRTRLVRSAAKAAAVRYPTIRKKGQRFRPCRGCSRWAPPISVSAA
jgi:hypothetical protein